MSLIEQRMKCAIQLLNDMIDGGEECRGRDSEISHIIGVLEGDANHLNCEAMLSLRVHGVQPNEG